MHQSSRDQFARYQCQRCTRLSEMTVIDWSGETSLWTKWFWWYYSRLCFCQFECPAEHMVQVISLRILSYMSQAVMKESQFHTSARRHRQSRPSNFTSLEHKICKVDSKQIRHVFAVSLEKIIVVSFSLLCTECSIEASNLRIHRLEKELNISAEISL
jgi:hypothetical protein